MARIRSRYRRVFYGHGVADPLSAPEVSSDRVTYVHPADLDEFLRRHSHQAKITFDDGYVDNLTVALPILERYATPATVFVTTGFIERSQPLLSRIAAAVARHDDWSRPSVEPWLRSIAPDKRKAAFAELRGVLKKMPNHERFEHQQAIMADYGLDPAELTSDYLTLDQLRELDAHPLITIGAHTISHPDLRHVTDAELHEELVTGRDRLEDWLGHRVTTLAYPFGDTDERVRRAAAAAGYKRAYVTTNHGWRSEIPFLRRFDWPRRDLAWEVFRMRERDRKLAKRQSESKQ